MRKILKILHTLGAIGFAGALAAQLALLAITPEPGATPDYALMREAIAAVGRWVLFPSMGAVVVSGLLAMAFNPVYHDAGWAWVKLLFGIIVFEGTLVAVHGPALREAERAAAALAGTLDPALLGGGGRNEAGAMAVILGVALLNVVLAVWRPRFSRRKAN